jgi:hypothetical protein
LGVHDVVEQRPVVEVVADHHPAARDRGGLAHGVFPAGDSAGLELLVEQLGEPALGLAAVAAEVPEVQVMVLVAQQRERVVDRHRAQRRVDLVALDLGVVELVEHLAALIDFLDVALVELVVVGHRLLGDAVQLRVKGGSHAG